VNFGPETEFQSFYNVGPSKMSLTHIIIYVVGRRLRLWGGSARPIIIIDRLGPNLN
jgi:hypothetical protein